MKSFLDLLLESIWDDVIDIWSKEGIDKTEVNDTLEMFRDLVNKNKISGVERDIQYWKNKPFNELDDFVNNIYLKYIENKKSVKKIDDLSEEAPIVFQNKFVKIYQIKSQGAACKLGSDTPWCITKEKENYLNTYDYDGDKFYFAFSNISKSPNDKIAIKYNVNDDEYTLINRKNEPQGVLKEEEIDEWLLENDIPEDMPFLVDFKLINNLTKLKEKFKKGEIDKKFKIELLHVLEEEGFKLSTFNKDNTITLKPIDITDFCNDSKFKNDLNTYENGYIDGIEVSDEVIKNVAEEYDIDIEEHEDKIYSAISSGYESGIFGELIENIKSHIEYMGFTFNYDIDLIELKLEFNELFNLLEDSYKENIMLIEILQNNFKFKYSIPYNGYDGYDKKETENILREEGLIK